MRKSALIVLSAAALLAAAPAYAGDATILGTGIGAAIGGLFGSQIGSGSGQAVATGIGVAAGAMIGNTVGQSVDQANRAPAYPAPTSYGYDDALQPVFENPYTPNYVAPPEPPPIYTDPSSGAYCREFSQEASIGGREREVYGTACLQPDGTWRVVP
ncbi:MAG: glycine zipper 2TM domain-containing protein [Alphaproteobacteria bacterium]|nr:glycine zipper 2TM domain-containing protein [Alphaproteobacteria bacterium]